MALDTLVTNCRIYGCIPFITFLPNSTFWNPNFSAKYFEAQLKHFSIKNQIRFINLNQIIDSDILDNFAPRGGHYSIKGYEKVGKHIARELGFK